MRGAAPKACSAPHGLAARILAPGAPASCLFCCHCPSSNVSANRGADDRADRKFFYLHTDRRSRLSRRLRAYRTKRGMVEAVGVEPTSETTANRERSCFSQCSICLVPRALNGQRNAKHQPDRCHPWRSSRAPWTIPLCDVRSQPVGEARLKTAT